MKKGMALITILMMILILVILITAMVGINSNRLFYSSRYFKKTSALVTAEAGVAFAMYALGEDFTWKPEVCEHETRCGKFTIKFYHSGYSPSFFSYNNLGLSSSFQPGAAFDGTDVRENSVDLVVTGEVGNVFQRIRVILTRSITNDAGRCSGTLDVDANEFRLSKVITPQDPTEKGSFHTNSSGEPTLHPAAINVDLNCAVISNDGNISAVGDIAPLNTSDTTVESNAPAKNITDIDIMEVVNSKIASLSPSDLHPGGTYTVRYISSGSYELRYGGTSVSMTGTRVEDGTLIISDDLCFTGDVEFKFVGFPDDTLSKAGIFFEKSSDFYPSLYIQGDGMKDHSFQVMGKIEGNGSIYTSGTSSFIMETNLVASEDPGVALLSQGDVDINLPATHVRPVELDMTGLVYTHGNINASILDDFNPDNPENDPISPWSSDWEDAFMGIQEEAYALPLGNFDIYSTVSPPASAPDLYWNYTGGDHGEPSNPINGFLIDNEDGTFTFQGGENNGNPDKIRAFWGPHGANGAIALDIGDGNSVIFGPHGTSPAMTWEDESLVNLFGSETAAYESLYDTLVAYDFSSDSNAVLVNKTPSEELYAPSVRITGALIVVDPDNTDGSGSYNSLSGNIYVDLNELWAVNKGNFNLKYASNYEKLLGNPMIVNNLKVTSWEEVR